MTAFHKKSFHARLATMGDTSEGIFDSLHHGRVHELGLNRIWANGEKLYMAKMTAAMRYTPDRMTATGFVECMGIGADGTLKIKLEKLEALDAWSEVGPVDLFVYDQSNHVTYQAPVDLWEAACAKHGTLKSFPEGKEYYALHRNNFPVAPDVIEAVTNVAA